jgi:hypothetical protein
MRNLEEAVNLDLCHQIPTHLKTYNGMSQTFYKTFSILELDKAIVIAITHAVLSVLGEDGFNLLVEPLEETACHQLSENLKVEQEPDLESLETLNPEIEQRRKIEVITASTITIVSAEIILCALIVTLVVNPTLNN